MSAGRVIAHAYDSMAGVVGGMVLALVREKPVPSADIRNWVKRLRRAADELEKLIE